MTKVTLMDRVVDKLHGRRTLVRSKLAEQFKKTKPFRMEEISPEEQVYWYNQLTPEMEQTFRQQAGDDVMDKYIGKMESLKRRMGNART